VLFHASLAGEWGGFDFARLALLAWPAALLLLWPARAAALPGAAMGATAGLAAAASLALAVHVLSDAVVWQRASYPWPAIAVRRLTAEQPRWFDFGSRFERPARPAAPAGP
jgi:hypothetical protein